MKLGLALRELHRSELALVRELLAVSERHRAEHEVHHIARDLAAWSREHVRVLAATARDYGLDLEHEAPEEVSGHGTGTPVRLLGDLRRLHLDAAGVSLDWELLAQGAQALKDTRLLGLAQLCHPETLRQMKWANAMLKNLAPQILAS
ncbi:hypothetical protein HFP15_13775 [Amycolatopsis sp. K13G38]|uniref:DUF892 family protein n=1 Tax=Amycolatopsis acididurans TaxID=2724524 RepID=A0ABX1J3L2_9PSEU|nr:hypothetical protein [Amycolatopsis acididurans]NKQ53951.1 hypothetical protein [Amycolatopsis acididurans]